MILTNNPGIDDSVLDRKWNRLQEILRGYGSAAIAFSGGVDSTFMLRAAREALGERMAAATAVSCFFPERERREAEDYCKAEGIRHILCYSNELEVPGIRENPKNRCYLCKKDLFGKIAALAEENGLAVVCEGSNMDDMGDYRPGLQAVAELGIKSPLREAGLYKAEIRELSRRLGLATAEKPSFACLASRFVYGETITEEKLNRVDRAEQLLLNMGFSQMRVRIHGDMARIEVLPEELPRLTEPANRQKIVKNLREMGFSYVTVDLSGYRTGSMNEAFHRKEH